MRLTKKQIDDIFDNREHTHQMQVFDALYRLVFPKWDDIEHVDGMPQAGEELSRYVMGRFMVFDRAHHPNVLNGGLWLNSGWSTNADLHPWSINTDNCRVEMKEGKAA